jgi:hypothetical protein
MKPKRKTSTKSEVGVRELARRVGVSGHLVSRKRRQGKSDEQITREAQLRANLLRIQGKSGKAVSIAPTSDWKRRTQEEDVEDFASAQARKEVALANLRELEEAEKRRNLLPADEVRDAVNGMVIGARAKLLVIGDELADKLASTSNAIKCREMVDERVAQALAELTEYPRQAA